MGERAIFYLIITVLCALYAVLIFFGKAPLFSVTYLMMDKKMKKKMKTKEECRFLSMTFGGIAILAALMTIGEVTKISWMTKLVVVWAIVLLIFIFIQSVRKGLKK